MIRIRGALIALMVVLLAAALVACGGDDDETDANTDGGNGTEVTATAAPDGEDATPEDAGDPTDEPEATEPEGDDGDEPAGQDVEFDPCSFLSQADVESALGESVQAPVVTYTSVANIPGSGSQAEVGTCNYVAPSGVSSVSITTYRSTDTDAIDGMVQGACGGKEELDIGDFACWYDSAHLEIQMASNGHFLDIFLTFQGDTTSVLKALAEAAASNT